MREDRSISWDQLQQSILSKLYYLMINGAQAQVIHVFVLLPNCDSNKHSLAQQMFRYIYGPGYQLVLSKQQRLLYDEDIGVCRQPFTQNYDSPNLDIHCHFRNVDKTTYLFFIYLKHLETFVIHPSVVRQYTFPHDAHKT